MAGQLPGVEGLPTGRGDGIELFLQHIARDLDLVLDQTGFGQTFEFGVDLAVLGVPELEEAGVACAADIISGHFLAVEQSKDCVFQNSHANAFLKQILMNTV